MGKRLLLVLVAGIILTAGARAEPGAWKRVGNAGEWKDTIAGTTFKNRIYTVEKSGGLFVTDPATGAWKQLGKAEFANTTHLFPTADGLNSIESDGSMYRVNPEDGSWERVGNAGDWKDTAAGTSLNGSIYTAEKNGGLYETNPATGERKQLGKPEFAATTFMFASGTSLYTIENDGSLYRVSPADGSWERVGNAGDWKGTAAGVGLKDRLYTTESSGALYETDPATGQWKQLGEAAFGNTTHMFHARGKLYTIENDGSLYEVDVK